MFSSKVSIPKDCWNPEFLRIDVSSDERVTRRWLNHGFQFAADSVALFKRTFHWSNNLRWSRVEKLFNRWNYDLNFLLIVINSNIIIIISNYILNEWIVPNIGITGSHPSGFDSSSGNSSCCYDPRQDGPVVQTFFVVFVTFKNKLLTYSYYYT